jgi:hypothetical protein
MLAGDGQLALGKVKRLFVMSCEILRRSQHVEEAVNPSGSVARSARCNLGNAE